MYKQQCNSAALDTQERICTRLLTELEKKNISQVKITNLCKAAGVSRNAFYRNFETLEDVLLYHLDQVCMGMVDELSGLPYEKDFLVTYFTVFFRFWYRNRDCLELFFRNKLSNILVERLADMIEFTIERNRGSHVTPIKGYMFLASGLVGIMYSWITENYDITPEKLAENMVQNLRRSLV